MSPTREPRDVLQAGDRRSRPRPLRATAPARWPGDMTPSSSASNVVPCCHRAQRLARLEAPVDDAHERDDAAVLVVGRVEDERARRRVRVARRRRDALDDRVEHRLDALAGLRRDAQRRGPASSPTRLRELGGGARRGPPAGGRSCSRPARSRGRSRARGTRWRASAPRSPARRRRPAARPRTPGASARPRSVKSTCPGVSIRLSSWPFQRTRTACALIVMPRSRSSSIESSSCSRISRSDTAPVSSRMRSASVDLPWSMCAMIAKLRIRSCSTAPNVLIRAGPAAAAVPRARGSRAPGTPRRRRCPRRRALPPIETSCAQSERPSHASRRVPRAEGGSRGQRAAATTMRSTTADVRPTCSSPTRRRIITSSVAAATTFTTPSRAGSPRPRGGRRPRRARVQRDRAERDRGRHPVRLHRVEAAVEDEHPAVEDEPDRERLQALGDDRGVGQR